METKYITLDPFADRKHSTRTDGDIRKLQMQADSEDLCAGFKPCLNESSSITPKLGFYSIEEVDSKKTKPSKKMKIKSSKSSNRLGGSESSSRENKSKVVVTKDEQNNVYHIISKESIKTNQDLGKLSL